MRLDATQYLQNWQIIKQENIRTTKLVPSGWSKQVRTGFWQPATKIAKLLSTSK